MKKALVFAFGGALVAAAFAGSATAGNVRHPLAQAISQVAVLSVVHAVSPSCAPVGNAEFSAPVITNDTGAVIPKGTTIWWSAHQGNAAPFKKGHVTLTSDLAKGANFELTAGLQGNTYKCSAVFFEL